MTLPGSGPLSISAINSELGGWSTSLRSLSSAAGKGTPDAISEFYGFKAWSASGGNSVFDSGDSGQNYFSILLLKN